MVEVGEEEVQYKEECFPLSRCFLGAGYAGASEAGSPSKAGCGIV